MRKHLGVETGDVLMVNLTGDNTAEIIPCALVPKDQIWFASREMQARVAKAEEDVAAGRTTRVSSPKELRAHLDRLKGGAARDR